IGAEKGIRSFSLYNDWALDHLLYTLRDQLPSSCYLPKELEILFKYDQENNSKYVETLKTYLYNFLDNHKTYNLLDIHRNTLLHRLNKIEELTGINLNDTVLLLRLLIAFKIMEQ